MENVTPRQPTVTFSAAAELEQELRELADDYWYQEESEMKQPSATVKSLTEKEALWLYDYLLDHTGLTPQRPESYETMDRSLRHRLTVPGMKQADLRELVHTLRTGH